MSDDKPETPSPESQLPQADPSPETPAMPETPAIPEKPPRRFRGPNKPRKKLGRPPKPKPKPQLIDMLSPGVAGMIDPALEAAAIEKRIQELRERFKAPPVEQWLTHWSYETPLEQPPDDVKLNPLVIEINGMKFQARSDCNYRNDYYRIVRMIEEVKVWSDDMRKEKPLMNELNIFRNIIQQDLWFFVYFVMKNPLANHPFIVEACKEIQDETGDSLEVWARDHLKTTIISIARPCQKILNDPERRIGIFSAVRPLAVKIQNAIKKLLECDFLVKCFPDILYEDPYKEAPKWTEAPEGGLIVKRKGFYKESTVSSWGLVEGMPTGDHYTDMVFDDIVTQDLQSPEIIEKVCDNFEMAENIGTRDRQITVAGTFYRHDDPLVYIMNKTDLVTGQKLFKLRKKAATIDGTINGKSAFLPERSLAKKRAGKLYFFYCQQLLDPTPRGMEKLNRDHLIKVKRGDLPINLYKFMLIDGAGDVGRRVDRKADSWAMMVIGVEPYRDDYGMSRIYLLDVLIEEMSLDEAQKAAVAMYCRNGRIIKLGIEKVGMSTTEIHICSALRAKNKFLSKESGNLQILKPGGRSKEFRIESAISMPLKHGKIHYLDTIPLSQIERIKLEMEKFPAWADDGLDAMSYVYDIIKDYRFGDLPIDEKPLSKYEEAFKKARERTSGGWIAV